MIEKIHDDSERFGMNEEDSYFTPMESLCVISLIVQSTAHSTHFSCAMGALHANSLRIVRLLTRDEP